MPQPLKPGYISEHFTWYEVTHSETAEREGISNIVPKELVSAAIHTAQNMEIARTLLLDNSIKVNSWFRCAQLQRLPQFWNPTSQHPKAEAVDFVCVGFGSPVDICKRLTAYPDIFIFDQLILEHSWVHVSFNSIPGAKQRMQVLSLLASGKSYARGLTDKYGKSL